MKVHAYGLAVDSPAGWEVRIGRRSAAGTAPGADPRPILHAATIALPEERGDFGGGVTGLLGGEDVFVTLFEYEPAAADKALFAVRGRPRPTAADFSPMGLQRTIPGQTGRQWFFSEGGRAYCLYVVLGSHSRRAELVQRLSPLLASLTLDPA